MHNLISTIFGVETVCGKENNHILFVVNLITTVYANGKFNNHGSWGAKYEKHRLRDPTTDFVALHSKKRFIKKIKPEC